jgi:hypothetical protein
MTKNRGAGKIYTLWKLTAAGPPESDSRRVSKSREEKTTTFTRDTSNNCRSSQLEHYQQQQRQ